MGPACSGRSRHGLLLCVVGLSLEMFRRVLNKHVGPIHAHIRLLSSERCDRHGLRSVKRCASERAEPAPQARAGFAASASADTSLSTACQIRQHFLQDNTRFGTGPQGSCRSLLDLWQVYAYAGCAKAPWFRRMRHSLRPCNPPRCTARANPCLGHPCGAPND